MTTLALSACSTKSEDDGVNNFRIKRGTNVSHWLSQSEERGEARLKHIQEDDFARLDSLGFDFVRLPIDEVQFWDENGNKIPEAWELMHNAINWAEKHHLRTIVDLHIIRSHYFNAVNEGDKEANTLFTSEKAQQDLINMWYQLSDDLKGYSVDSVAYEFMNEPVADDHEQWNQLIAKVHKALREREPNRTLVIGSNRWQGHETMKYLKVPEGDKNIILSFHYYNPMILTHYGAWWAPIGKYTGKVNYPGILVSKTMKLLPIPSRKNWSLTLHKYGISTRFVSSSRMPSMLPRSIISNCSAANGACMSLSIVNSPTSGQRTC